MHRMTRSTPRPLRLALLLAAAVMLIASAAVHADPPRYFEVDWPAGNNWHEKLVPVVAPHAAI